MYHVLVEELLSSGAGREWRVSRADPIGPDRGKAREAARDVAFGHKPRHPRLREGRQVFQLDDDTWTVLVPGVTAQFHFRVSVARRAD